MWYANTDNLVQFKNYMGIANKTIQKHGPHIPIDLIKIYTHNIKKTLKYAKLSGMWQICRYFIVTIYCLKLKFPILCQNVTIGPQTCLIATNPVTLSPQKYKARPWGIL